MFKDEYRNLMDQVQPPADAVSEVLAGTGKVRFPRSLAAVALAVLLAVPVLAVQSPVVRDWLYGQALKDDERFVPVRLADTCGGITVEVCGLMKADKESLLPGPGLLLLVEYADGTPLEEGPEIEIVYFDGATTWYVDGGIPVIWTERTEKLIWLELSNPGAGLEELIGVTTTILIDRMYIGERLVEGPWKIAFEFSEDLIVTEPAAP